MEGADRLKGADESVDSVVPVEPVDEAEPHPADPRAGDDI